jgi:predicted nucleotidyltransferase
MKFGLTPPQYQFIIDTVLLPLESVGATIWCCGSRARGNHLPFSDLDLMVETDKDLSREVSRIQEMLQNNNFPFKVDLVLFSEFAESYKVGYQKDRKPFRS